MAGVSSLIVQFGSGNIRRLPLHQNPGLEIVLIQRGRLRWQAEAVEEELKPGTVYFTLPGQVHGSSEEYEPGHEWMFIVIAAKMQNRSRILLPGELPLPPSDVARISRLLTGSRRHAHQATLALGVLLGELLQELREPGPLHGTQVRLLAAGVVVELARSIKASRTTPEPSVVGGAEFKVRCLVERLRQDPSGAWKLDRLAEECGLRRSHFSTLLQAETGDTPMRFLNRLRIELARKMLRESALPITRIALECGFESSQYFARVFQQFSGGVSARSYRARIRDEAAKS